MKINTIILIVKGVLLWVTMFSTILYVSAVDSLTFIALITWLFITVILIGLCKYCITKDEFMILSGNTLLAKYFPEMFKEEEDED